MRNNKRSLFAGVLVICLLFGMIVQGEEAFTYADTIPWDGEYDVVVAGFGGAGSIAAKNAADAGAKVLIVEKAPLGGEGGNTKFCGQLFVYGNEDYDATLIYYQKLAGNHPIPEKMLEVYVKSIARMYDVVAEELQLDKANFTDWTGTMLGSMSPEYPEYPGADKISLCSTDGAYSNAALWNAMRKQVVARAEQIDVWFESPAVGLIQDPQSKTIIGVRVQREGKTLNIRALNGVVLATGGFENNREMVQTYLGLDEAYAIGSLYNTGDGIRMALDVGADLWHMEAFEGIAFAGGSSLIPKAGEHARMFTQTALLFGSAFIAAEDGSRFIKEDEMSRHGHIATGGVWMNPRFPKNYFCIVDAAQYAAALASGLEQDYPYTYSGATIEELAAKAGINAEGLKKTFDQFNKFASDGVDLKLGRFAQTMKPLGEGPYYAIKIAPSILNTQGGPRRNENAEVLDRDGKAIPHLYSAGELGGLTALQYQGGGNIAECFVFGAIAGKNAAANKEALPAYQIPQKVESKPVYVPGFLSDLEEESDQLAGDGEGLTGEGQGMGGKLVVMVTLDGDKMTKVEVISHSETKGIADLALEQMPGRIVEAQSAEVDGVTGATITSNAIKEAVKAALGGK